MICLAWIVLSNAALVDQDAVRAGAQALGEGPRVPWYDASADQLRRAATPPPRDAFLHRGSQWSQQPPNAANTNYRFNLNFDLWGAVQVVAWLLLIFLLAVAVLMLISNYLKREALAANRGPGQEQSAELLDEGKVEALPAPLPTGKGDLLSMARQAYEEGDLRRAIICLYSYQLLRLDGSQMIQLGRGKTNRQYLVELRRRPELRRVLERTMVAFEDVYFGNHVLPRERFEACWSQLDDFHWRLEKAAA